MKKCKDILLDALETWETNWMIIILIVCPVLITF